MNRLDGVVLPAKAVMPERVCVKSEPAHLWIVYRSIFFRNKISPTLPDPQERVLLKYQSKLALPTFVSCLKGSTYQSAKASPKPWRMAPLKTVFATYCQKLFRSSSACRVCCVFTVSFFLVIA